MELDPVTLARIQFATNISFHILFPTINIAMAWVLLFFKVRFRQTGDQGWMDAYAFWVKIFALSFALGVVSGVTMSFQFGTNWPGYMQTVGNIAGPLLAYEILTAFFLEAGFLGIMLFGRSRVPEKVHTLATLLVAGGNTLSAFWIIALNSWMQTPAGFVMRDGRAHVLSWIEVIFNPSMPYRLTHMLLASGLTVAFLIAGLSAYRYLRGDRGRGVMLALKSGVFLAALLIPLQMFVGDMHGLNTLKHQPAKLAAIEGIWHTEKNVPLLLFALPNAETRSNDYAVGVPELGSLILTHKWGGEIKGLNEFEQHPPVAKVFWSFRVMVAMGGLMLLASWLAAWQLKKRGELAKPLARLLVGMTFAGWIATLAGWFVTEIGRQPWLVTGVLTTAQAAGKATAPMLFTSLGTYLALYALLLLAYISVLFHLARKAGAHETADAKQLKEQLA
ncbi:cytochrome ubiquinol oxidase subunit I [Chromobacterium subtsugae]|uniref:Cytochrome ubiquinol oxidase subunit I n=1 Tax=Chromobacterium subtsugae TaxID=251747 RepID=A0ABS7FF59_9NEIS|nr:MULTISPECIES: cytochrome ubiquinol oxidase subunit I [Chromobacterium]KUM03641.1 cytochrome D ubiquinol oxidase subunit I [Chromobacterium subtsugae]KZE86901.1 cytochrome D ubiquinol oxidase subunit I [Chromobacterium sp. F49]MBW7566840.1 cytochrome ubiquinol oxidase subunit I [Chromobacterium subtsugae]MBW8288145.1 cytochrome ubiquinol oxidase subunit I [Chromobacterium subtsugae]OBU86559.1 cytochrome D ubiquinol oxidase subunit I [Chromobacterium subtsugae]